jgi:hypothetical protein
VSAGELLDRITPSKSDRNPLPLVDMPAPDLYGADVIKLEIESAALLGVLS